MFIFDLGWLKKFSGHLHPSLRAGSWQDWKPGVKTHPGSQGNIFMCRGECSWFPWTTTLAPSRGQQIPGGARIKDGEHGSDLPKSLKQRQVPGEYDKKCLTYPNMKYPIDKDWIRFKLNMNDVLLANIHSRHQVLKDFFQAGTWRKMLNVQGVAGTFESQCRCGCAIHWFQADWGASG